MAPVVCRIYHSEHDHTQQFGAQQYPAKLRESDYHCKARAELVDEPWTYVACPEGTRAQGYTCTICRHGEHWAHGDAIMVSVDGGCRNNGTHYADSGIGIFFHRDSDLTRAMSVDTGWIHPHTSQRAELLAAWKALKMAYEIWERNPARGTHPAFIEAPGPYRKLRRVVIRADSQYLVGAMTDWIFKWRDNGYVNARGVSVVNKDLFRRLDDAVDDLKRVGVAVQFWHVARIYNQEADCLASAAMDGIDPQTALYSAFDY